MREAEGIVQRRYEELIKWIPDYVQRSGSEKIMEYLSRHYDKAYFEDRYQGEFGDIYDFLDVQREADRIHQEVARQEDIQRREAALEMQERERDLARELRDKVSSSGRKKILDNHAEDLERSITQQKRELKVATKTKLVIPAEKVIDTTKTAEERGVALESTKKLEEEEKVSPGEKAKAKAKAAKQIRIAKEAVRKEEDLAKSKDDEELAKKKEEKVSAFPGIRPRIKPERQWLYPDVEHALAHYHTLAGTKTKIYPKTAVEHAIEEGLQTRTAIQAQTATQTKTATQLQTQTQTQTAVQTAVKTALKEQTQTATKEEIEIATRLITEIVTKTKTHPKTMMPPRRPIMEPTKGKQKKLRQGPALASLKQGLFYITWYPPFRHGKTDVIFSRHKPHWAATAKGRGSPQKTLRVFGKVPPLMELPMGVVTARVKHGRHLTFSRRKVNGRKKRGSVR